MSLEQEVKLAFASVDEARRAVEAAGGQLVCPRRLLDDRLLDTADRTLAQTGTALRIRRDGEGVRLTWKGPIQPGPVKAREELETAAEDAGTLMAICAALGYRSVFRQQKFREEYRLDDVLVTIDETPAGIFIEIEATPEAIAHVAARLGRTPADYLLESYPAIWRRWCASHGRRDADMVF
jgi:predicted adenylyl cyclase CyaB